MSSLKVLNPKAEHTNSLYSLVMNIGAAKSLQNILRTNLGPRGTIKMLENFKLINHNSDYLLIIILGWSMEVEI